MFVKPVTQKHSQQQKKHTALCVGALCVGGCSLEVSDWQAGELVATGSSSDDMSPTTHYTRCISGSRDGMSAGSPGLFSSSVHESHSGGISQASRRRSF